jgi:hypothetical protein
VRALVLVALILFALIHTTLLVLDILLVFNSATPGLFCGFNALFIGLDTITGTLHAHQTARCLPGSLELADGRLSEQVNLDQVTLEGTLEGDDGLDEERVGVLEVEMHDTHHANTHKLTLEQAAELLRVVCVHGGSDGLGLLGRSHGSRLNILDDGKICQSS